MRAFCNFGFEAKCGIIKREKGKMRFYGVNPNKEKELFEKMRRLKISEKDIEEKFIRSSGKGGQNVNKRSTCVYLKHKPTQIEVKCQKERSQALNRFLALRLLVDKIEQMMFGAENEIRRKIEKIRRQKRKRSKRAKMKMLEAKRKHSAIKRLRSLPPDNDM